jgi:Fe-S-cluster containining protein
MVQLKNGIPIQPEAFFPFACLGCGDVCCRNLATIIHATTPEYIRIIWHLMRNPAAGKYLHPETQFVLDRHFVTGLPIMKLITIPPRGACPLAYQSDEEGMDPEQYLCAIHPARPSDCRLFPLIMTNTRSLDDTPLQTEYFVINYCPGFDLPRPGQHVYPGYTVPDTAQTAQTWVDGQISQEFKEEILYNFFDVVSYYYFHGWYLPSEERPDGKLDETTFDRLAHILFEIPPPPADRAEDHQVIMQRLLFLRENMESIIDIAKRSLI